MDSIKTYLVEVVFKKIASAGVQSGISALVIFLIAHQDYFERIGITTFTWGQWPNAVQPSGRCTLIEWDTLSIGGAAALFSAAVMAYVWFQHHAVATVKGAPQSGDLRKIDVPVADPTRKTDPQIGEQK